MTTEKNSNLNEVELAKDKGIKKDMPVSKCRGDFMELREGKTKNKTCD